MIILLTGKRSGRLKRHGRTDKTIEFGGIGKIVQSLIADQTRDDRRQCKSIPVGMSTMTTGGPAVAVLRWIGLAKFLGQALTVISVTRQAI